MAGWLLLRVSGEEKYSLLYDSAMKVHALLPNRPVKVDWEYWGGKCQLMTLSDEEGFISRC